MHSIYVSMYLAFRKGRRSTKLAARMSLIAPLHFVDRETRWHRRRTSIWRTRAKVARSALTRVRKCKSRTSTIEFETYLSVIAMQRRRSMTRTVDSRWKKNMKKLYLTKVNRFAQAKWQNKKRKRQMRLQYLDALRETDELLVTRLAGPK
jgi:hypothetical protein